jgi:L-alanine-DL-glutamate epimerase-like enolase superfamily enzyme
MAGGVWTGEFLGEDAGFVVFSSMRILGGSLHRLDVRLRMPFRYGIATMTDGPVLFVRLEVEMDDGVVAAGVASDLLPPKWFTKIPAKSIGEEIQEMLRVIEHARDRSVGLRGPTAFVIWEQLYSAQTIWAAQQGIPPLLANFGVSLVERALLDATARASRASFAQLVQSNALGIDLGRIHPELKGTEPRKWLPARPLSSIILRHTVGLLDPLTEDGIPEGERLEDGLPQSLEAGIQAYGLRHFKIKVNGVPDVDLQRVREVAQVITRLAPRDYGFSLDGNEQFKSVDAFRAFWEMLERDHGLRDFLGHLLFVEQPLPRDVALASAVGTALGHWPGHPPMIIDESDGALGDFRLALELGYAGTSHKNCKGVFKGLAHGCLIAARRERTDARLLMSGEDLCNTGPVALLQDLAVMATLGIHSVERNGHHYHAGLSQFPAGIQQTVLAAHPDLYRRMAAGWPTLRVEGGEIKLDTINRAPFGVGFEFDRTWISTAG